MLKHHDVRFVAMEAGPRVQRERRASPFKASYTNTCELLDRELTQLAAESVVIQLDCDRSQIRNDGMPRADARTNSPEVIVSCESKYGPLSYPCGAFTAWQDNLRAIALALEALRKVDRYGVTKTGEQYRGWKAITYRGDDQFQSPQAAAEWLSKLDAVLFTAETLLGSRKALEEAFRACAKKYHPDAGGEASAFSRVTAAVEMLRGYHERRKL